tara:strand:+ start:1299 stop:1880 length:582 start_codon:yes stop_codon:yes gene_type:complete
MIAEEKKTAARAISTLKVMFPSFAAKMDDDEEWMNFLIEEWSKGLSGIPMVDVLHGIELVRRSGSEFAPSLPKFIEYCGGRPKLNKGLEDKRETTKDYAQMWMNADDKAKYRFFFDHPKSEVPGYVQVWFKNYNKQHRGWTNQESQMMINFHCQPQWLDISESEQDARREKIERMKDDHQKNIINYFMNRRSA